MAHQAEQLLDRTSRAPAYALTGTQAAVLAQEFIQRLFCDGGCGECAHCRKLSHGSHPDVRWVRPVGLRIKIDQIRALQRLALYPPYEAAVKVYVIEQADALTREAANSLLKILESPPPYLVFLLLTQRLGDLLPTVVSRCRVVRSGKRVLDEEVERACWGDPHWLEVFSDTALDPDPIEATPEALRRAWGSDELMQLYAATHTTYDMLGRCSLPQVLQLAQGLSKAERAQMSYTLQGLTVLCHQDHPRPTPEVLKLERALLRSYGALWGNANVTLLVESFLLKLHDLMSAR